MFVTVCASDAVRWPSPMKLFLVLCTILATFDEAFFGLRHTLPMAPKGVKERGRSKPAVIKEPIIDSKKQPGGAAKAKAKALVCKAAAVKSIAEYAGQIDRWAGKRSVRCQSCDQWTSQRDRHSLDSKPKFLHWTQARTTAASRQAAAAASAISDNNWEVVEDRFPSGTECYSCYDVRRKFWPGHSQLQLIEKRHGDSSVDDDFNDKRHDLVSEGGKFKGKVPKLGTVEKGDKHYDRSFVSGTAAKLWDFARKRKLVADSDDELIDLIKKKYPTYKIMVNKLKEIIVEIQDQTDGEYRYERGTDDYIEYHKLERYDDADDHAEAFENKVAKREAKEMDRTLYGGCSTTECEDFDGGDGNISTLTYPESVPFRMEEASPARSARSTPQRPQPPPQAQISAVPVPVEIILDSQPGAQQQMIPLRLGRQKSSSNLGSHARLPLCNRSVGSSECSATLQQDGQGLGIHGNDGQSQDGGNGSDSGRSGHSHGDVAGAVAVTGGRKGQDERMYQEGKKALDSILADFGEDCHIDHSRQSKACEAAISRLRKHARKCSGSGDEDVRGFGQQLWDISDEIEERQSLWDDSRNKFAAVVCQAPTQRRSAILATMASTTICNLVQREAPRLSDAALTNQMTGRALFLSVSGHNADVKAQGVGLHLIKDDDTMVKQCQRPIIHSHLESILKQPSPAALYTAANNFVGGSDLASKGYHNLKLALDQVPERLTNHEPLLWGFCPQLTADMICVLVMGEVARCMSINVRVPGPLHDLIRSLVQQRGKLSGRVRCYHKHIGGVSHSARDAWRTCEKIAEASEQTVCCAADDIEAWVSQIQSARGKSQVDLLAALGDITCGNFDNLITLGQWLVSADEAGNSTNAEVHALALQLRDELVEAAGKVVKDADFHAAAYDDRTLVKETQTLVEDTQLVAAEVEAGTTAAAAADANAARVVKDKEFFDDSDNLPDPIAMTCVTSQICSILKEFPHDGAGNQVFKDAENRASMIFETWRLQQYDITDKFTIFDKLRAFAELCRKYLIWSGPAAGRIVDAEKAAYQLQQFVDKASGAEFLEKVVEEYVSGLLENEGGNLTAVRRELLALRGSLPEAAQRLTDAAKAFEGIESLAQRIQQGKLPPTLIEINATLNLAVESTAGVAIASTRKHFVNCKLVVGTEFGSRFGLYEAQVQRMEQGIQTMKRRAGKIVEEINLWKFSSCSFVMQPKDSPDDEILAAAKSVELCWKTFDNTKQIASELASKTLHQPQVIKDAIQAINGKFENGEFHRDLKEARILLAHASLASVIINSKKRDDVASWPLITQKMVNYCKQTLGLLQLQEDITRDFALKLGLLSKVTAPATAAKSKIGKPAAASSASTCSTAAPASDAASLHLEAQRPNKFRRKQ